MITNVIIRKFYAAFNSIWCKIRQLDENTQLSLVHTNCLPMLLYSIAALNLSNCQINELNVAWNNAYRRIFGFHKWESVRQFIAGMGYTDLKHEALRLRVGFVKKGLVSSNQIVKFFAHRHFVTDLHSACTLFNVSFCYDDILKCSSQRIADVIKRAFCNSAGL